MHAGTPSVFIRTYRCNLSCTWCDTKYTWVDQDRARPGVDYTEMSISSAMDRISAFGCKHLVLTGGEPLLHQRSLAPLLASLKRQGFFNEVETNGTIVPSPEVMDSVDCFNVSPKLSNSLVEKGVRTRPQALGTLARCDKAWFKFVVCEEEDVDEVEEMVSRLELSRDRVILMPEGVDAGTILSRSKWVVEVCKERGFRFSPRLQILLYGNKRGM